MKVCKHANRETPKKDNPVESLKLITYNRILFYKTNWYGIYVSKSGKLLSLLDNKSRVALENAHILSPWLAANYYVINLRKTKNAERHVWLVHRIIAETFLGKCPKGYQVDHINEIRTDNRISNLQYLTAKDNHNKAHKGKPTHNRIPVVATFNNKKYYFDCIKHFLKAFDFPKWKIDKLVKYGEEYTLSR